MKDLDSSPVTQLNDVIGFLDIWPEAQVQRAGPLQVQGWVVDPLGPPMAIVITVDGAGVALAKHGFARPDVVAVYPSLAGASTSGWAARIEHADGLDDLAIVAAHAIRVTGETVSLGQAPLRRVARPSSPPGDLVGFIDVWGDRGPLLPGKARVQGWVVDRREPPFAVILSVVGKAVAAARVELSRPDVTAAYPELPCAATSGWEATLVVDGVQDDRAIVAAHVVRADGTVVQFGQALLREVARPCSHLAAPSGKADRLHWTEIPGWFRWRSAQEEAARRFPAGSIFIEVGSYLGRSLCSLGEVAQQSDKAFTLIGIDTCRGSGAEGLSQKDYHGAAVAEGGGTFAGALHKNVLACGFGETISLIVADSLTASRMFRDASVDWVHLDARHDYASVVADIGAWLPKVKPGGWLSGDDFDDVKWPEVVQAVGETLPGARPWSDGQWRWIVE